MFNTAPFRRVIFETRCGCQKVDTLPFTVIGEDIFLPMVAGVKTIDVNMCETPSSGRRFSFVGWEDDHKTTARCMEA